MVDNELESAEVQLPEIMDLNAAKELYDEIYEAMGKNISVDASIVNRMGGQCLQILLAAKISWERADHKFKIVNPSEGFIGSLGLLGVKQQEFLAKGE